ncbi:MAG TPA: hydrogenase expression/formation protein HypE [bacterium]|nr:hydrogenase expression/formation protein HypE [bacterium]
MNKIENLGTACPVPITGYPHVLLAHGGGGKLMHQLIEKVFHPAFKNPFLDQKHDSALLNLNGGKIALTTDSYVIHPLFFPGGDIGSLSVYGTVNDLAMAGAKPLYLSAGFILEEGLPMETLWKIVQSMKAAAEKSGIELVTGDTKVVDKGKGDGIFINTSGVGIVEHPFAIHPSHIRPDDAVLLSGDVGRHGIAIMAVREGLSFESEIESDSAPLNGLVLKLLEAGIRIHCMRDITRGGLATVLNELADARGLSIEIEEEKIPVREDVRGACEILGLDPFYVACEGRFVLMVSSKDSGRALAILQSDPHGSQAAAIGRVNKPTEGIVTLKNGLGTRRILDMLSGEQLPRIC